jgi:uncharacterized protein
MDRPNGIARVAVTGAGGFIGRSLVGALTGGGVDVIRMVRRTPRDGEAFWDPETGRIDAEALEGADAIVHLAGESISGVWTPDRKRRFLESRRLGTRTIAEAAARLRRPPAVLVSASGVGYYGDRGDATLDESHPAGTDFLARVCVVWEAATKPAADAGIRVVNTRFGVVLDPSGGVFAVMLPAFRLGLGGKLGNGRQWMSWVSREDAVSAIRFALDTPELSGPVNVVSPHPVRNEEFTAILGTVLRRPTWVPVPRFVLRATPGGMGEVLLLASQRAVPRALLEHGFSFRRPLLEGAVRAALGNDPVEPTVSP